MSPKSPAALYCVFGPYAGVDFPVDASGLIVGRDPTLSHIVIDNPAVSRNHARVHFSHDGHFFLEDMVSANGTYVLSRAGKWDRLAGTRRMRNGDRFSFLSPDGSETIVFEVRCPEEEASPSDTAPDSEDDLKAFARRRKQRNIAGRLFKKQSNDSADLPSSVGTATMGRHEAYRMKNLVDAIGEKTAGIDKDSISAYERLVSTAADVDDRARFERIIRESETTRKKYDESEKSEKRSSFATVAMIILGIVAGLPISYFLQPEALHDKLSLGGYMLYLPTVIGLSHSSAVLMTIVVTCVIFGCLMGIVAIVFQKKNRR